MMSDLGKRVGGERFLDCAAAFEYEVYFAIDVALEQLQCCRVEAGVHRLRQIDDHSSAVVHEDVEWGQVTVDHVLRQHQFDVPHQVPPRVLRLVGWKLIS